MFQQPNYFLNKFKTFTQHQDFIIVQHQFFIDPKSEFLHRSGFHIQSKSYMGQLSDFDVGSIYIIQ